MKKICFLAVLLSLFTALPAEEYLLYDFENYEIGTKFNLKNVPGRPVGEGSYAVVAADPTDSNNKVLHVLLVNSWDTYPEYPLPDGFTAADFCTYQSVAFSLYRPQILPKDDDYMQTAVWLGDKKVYQEVGNNNYPYQGERGKWHEKKYAFTPVETEASNFLLGLHSDNMEYYLDNIRLVRAGKGYDYTDETQTLRYYVEKCGNGKHIGVATPSSWKNVIDLNNDLHDMSQTVFRNFNMVVAEDNMKFAYIEPERNKFEFGYADALVDFAERHGMKVRGHTLCWHKQLPEWVTKNEDRNSHNYSREELLSILRNHIDTIVSHYKGRIAEWDVVNECLEDNQRSYYYGESYMYDLRASVWSKGIGGKLGWGDENVGGDFIDSAFVYAHRADPDAKLFLNDYGVENGGRKADAYYYLAKHLVDNNIPIHGVGLQCHFKAGELDSVGLVKQITRFQELGLEVIITELDIASSDKQADEFRTITNIFMEQKNCPNMVLWGVSDRDSWRSGALPLLFDADLAAKPAFFAVRDALEKAWNDILSVAPVPNDARPQSPYVDVYNLAGQKIASGMRRESVNFLPTGIYIVDGEKIMVR